MRLGLVVHWLSPSPPRLPFFSMRRTHVSESPVASFKKTFFSSLYPRFNGQY
jgi:hypothetical protein